jgi:hypothetical protein
MAKLKCDLHKRRVMTINGKFMHRGWGEACTSPTATIGGKKFTAKDIQAGLFDRSGA